MDSQLIDLKTFRTVLQLGRDYAYAAAREGRLKAFKGGRGRWMIPLSELRDFPMREIAAREVAE